MRSISFELSLIVLAFSIIISEGTDRVLKPEHVITFRVDGRIVNGSRAVAGQFPHQVSLRRKWTDSHFCGGSIISKTWILTAGHCMFRAGEMMKPSSFYIVAGAVQLNAAHSSPAQIRQIEEFFVHPKYDDDYLLNDIALLMLEKELVLQPPHVQAIALSTVTPSPNTACIVSGFGYLKEGGPVSNDLMYVNLPLLPRPKCKTLLSHLTLMQEGQICAGYIEGQKDACQGDSGGPFMCKGLLTGIVSGGEGCARPKLPGFYTEVAYYRKWIDKVQNSSGSCCKCACKRNSATNGSLASSSIVLLTVLFSFKTSSQ